MFQLSPKRPLSPAILADFDLFLYNFTADVRHITIVLSSFALGLEIKMPHIVSDPLSWCYSQLFRSFVGPRQEASVQASLRKVPFEVQCTLDKQGYNIDDLYNPIEADQSKPRIYIKVARGLELGEVLNKIAPRKHRGSQAE